MIPADAKLMIHHYSNLQFFQFLAEKIIFLFSVLEERQFSSPTFLQQIGNGFQRHKFLKNVFQKKTKKIWNRFAPAATYIIILDINLTKSSFILEGSFAETLKRQTNVGTDGRTNGGTDRQTDGRTDGRLRFASPKHCSLPPPSWRASFLKHSSSWRAPKGPHSNSITYLPTYYSIQLENNSS